MGVIKGGLLVIASVLLFLSFLVGNFLLTLNLSLDYENVKPEIVSIINEMAQEEFDLNQKINEIYPDMELYCMNNSEFVFNEQGYTFVTPCSIVAEGTESIIEYGTNFLIEDIYYDEYDCDFWNCFEETEQPLFLVSKKAQDYFLGKFYLVLFASIVLVALMFFLVEKKTNLPIIVGVLLGVSALLFVKFDWLFSFSSDNSFLQFFTIFFSKSSTVFLISFILGLLILLAGIILKLFVVGFKISNIFSKFSSKRDKGVSKKEIKGIVKEEISKGKNVKAKRK